MKDKYRRMSEMGALPLTLVFLAAIILTFGNCKNKGNQSDASAADTLTDDALMDTVQRRTFLYFWEGAEPNSGLAPERYHVDGVYPQNDSNVVTSGGSGFGIMAILAGIDRGYAKRDWPGWNVSFPSLRKPTVFTVHTLIGGMVTPEK